MDVDRLFRPSFLLFQFFFGFLDSAIFNADPRYAKWNRLNLQDSITKIPVYIDSTRYDFNSLSIILQAIAQINSDLNGCIQFFQVQTPLSSTRDFVYVSTMNNDGTQATTCASFPGRLVNQNRQGQKLLLVGGGGPGSCLGSVREAMRFFAIVLGLRNEFRRPDRLITVNAANLIPMVPSTMYDAYDQSRVAFYSLRPGFDFNSITMISPLANSLVGVGVFTIPSGINVGTLARLSGTDCAAIAFRYQCGGYCQDPYQQGIPFVTGGSGGYNFGGTQVINVVPGVLFDTATTVTTATTTVATTTIATTTAATTTNSPLPLPDY